MLDARFELVTAQSPAHLKDAVNELIVRFAADPNGWRFARESAITAFACPDGTYCALVQVIKGQSKIWRW